MGKGGGGGGLPGRCGGYVVGFCISLEVSWTRTRHDVSIFSLLLQHMRSWYDAVPGVGGLSILLKLGGCVRF